MSAMEDYIDELDLGRLSDRINGVVNAFEFLARSKLDYLFISDDIIEGDRIYPDMWGFAGHFWLQAREFDKINDLDISPFYHAIKYLGLQYENLRIEGGSEKDDEGEDGEAPKLRVEVETERVRYSLFSATGSNCDRLLYVVNEFLLPNLTDRD